MTRPVAFQIRPVEAHDALVLRESLLTDSVFLIVEKLLKHLREVVTGWADLLIGAILLFLAKRFPLKVKVTHQVPSSAPPAVVQGQPGEFSAFGFPC